MVRRQHYVEWPKPFKNADLERMAPVFGFTDDFVADYPTYDPEFRKRIGELIGSALDEAKRKKDLNRVLNDP